MTDYNEPAKGTEDWNQPLNENFGDLSIEVADEVATWGDLPSPTEVSQSSGGQWPVYRVEADDVYVRVTGSAQEIIGGLGSTDRPLPEQHVEKLSADRVDVKPLKLLFYTDTHWGNSSVDAFPPQTEKQNDLDKVINRANSLASDYEVHLVFGGDNIHEDTSSQTNSEQRITDFRNYVESGLNDNVNLHYLLGNHEYAKAGTWSYDWGQSQFGFASDSDTYYVIADHHHCKVLGLNSGFNDGTKENLQSWVPSGQLDWLREQIDTTDKPIFVCTHTPPFPSLSKAKYDTIGAHEQFKYARLLADADNVVGGVFGHNHHNVHDSVSTQYNSAHAESWANRRWFYQPFPHSLGGNNINNTSTEDKSVTPYGELSIRQDGHMVFEQSYADDGTDFRGRWPLNGASMPRSEVEDIFSDWRLNFNLDSLAPLAALDTTETGNGVEIHSGASFESAIYRVMTGATSGNVSEAAYHAKPPYRAITRNGSAIWNNEPDIDWPDEFGRAIADTTDHGEYYLVHGEVNISNGTNIGEHVGIYIDADNNAVKGTVGDGSNGSVTSGNLGFNTEVGTFSWQLFQDDGYAKFEANEGETDSLALDTNLPPFTQGSASEAPNKVMKVWAKTNQANAAQIRVHPGWIVRAGPALHWGDIR